MEKEGEKKSLLRWHPDKLSATLLHTLACQADYGGVSKDATGHEGETLSSHCLSRHTRSATRGSILILPLQPAAG